MYNVHSPKVMKMNTHVHMYLQTHTNHLTIQSNGVASFMFTYR